MRSDSRRHLSQKLRAVRGKWRDGFASSTPRQTLNTLVNRWERRTQRPTLASFPRILQVEVTNRCNLNCVFCSRALHPLKLGDFPRDLLPAVEEASGRVLETNLFGYGEPLVAEVFFELLGRVRSSRISFITNGLLLTGPVLERILATARRPLYNVAFSIDGANPETYLRIRERSDFDRVWENLENLTAVSRKTGAPREVWVDFVAMRGNVAELPELIRRCARLGVSRVNVFHLLVWDPRYGDESLVYHPGLNRECFSEARRTALEHGVLLDLPIPLGTPRGDGDPAAVARRDAPRCSQPWSYAYLRHDGSVHACCNSEGFVMGQLGSSRFEEIWNGEKYARFRGLVNRKLPPDCRRCELRFRYSLAPDEEQVYLKGKPRKM